MRARKTRRRYETKAVTQERHARRRFGERLDVDLTDSEYRAVIAAIASGASTFVERQSLRVTVHDVEVRGKTCRVVYDSQRHVVVTVLDPAWIEPTGEAP